MELKVYCDRMSQPSRAVLIFCKANGIEFEEVKIDLGKRQHHSPEYAEVNPMKEVPAIVQSDFKLFESHAILIYLASSFPGVADHWYPTDVRQRAKVQSVLDWHHTNLRRGSVGYIYNTAISLGFGIPGTLEQQLKAKNFYQLLLQESSRFGFRKMDHFCLEIQSPQLLI